jgi:uncharacterized protein (DUF2141 family)
MKPSILILIILASGLTCFSQKVDLTVIIDNIEKSEGTIYMSLHSNENTFPSETDNTVKTRKIEKFDSRAEITFEGLEKGDYALSFFQDLNGNEELDTNFVGFPKEPVGASNMTSLGRPKFSKCKFTISESKTLKVQYMN